MVSVTPDTLAVEHGRESVRFWYLALVDPFIGAFRLADEEFSGLHGSDGDQ